MKTKKALGGRLGCLLLLRRLIQPPTPYLTNPTSLSNLQQKLLLPLIKFTIANPASLPAVNPTLLDGCTARSATPFLCILTLLRCTNGSAS